MTTIRDIVTPAEVKAYLSGEEDYEVFEKIYEFFLNSGEMPIGVAKARSGDPYEWIFDRMEEEFSGD